MPTLNRLFFLNTEITNLQKIIAICVIELFDFLGQNIGNFKLKY